MSAAPWITTFTGRKFHVLDPAPAEICIEDIAHALSQICRYGGHCRVFYSVAQHSCYAADLLAAWYPGNVALQLAGLLHDATEAYLGDIVRPLKLALPDYIAAERLLDSRIRAAFNVTIIHRAELSLKRADNAILMAERSDIVNHAGHEWGINEPPAPVKIHPVAPGVAESLFLARFARLADNRPLSSRSVPLSSVSAAA